MVITRFTLCNRSFTPILVESKNTNCNPSSAICLPIPCCVVWVWIFWFWTVGVWRIWKKRKLPWEGQWCWCWCWCWYLLHCVICECDEDCQRGLDAAAFSCNFVRRNGKDFWDPWRIDLLHCCLEEVNVCWGSSTIGTVTAKVGATPPPFPPSPLTTTNNLTDSPTPWPADPPQWWRDCGPTCCMTAQSLPSISHAMSQWISDRAAFWPL